MLRHQRYTAPVVLVDDEEELLFSSMVLLRNHDISPVVTYPDSRQLMSQLEIHGASVVLLDLIMPNLTGRELLSRIQRFFPDIPVIIMTAVHEVETAVACMKEGAFDYLVKPVDENRFISSVQRAMERHHLQLEIGRLKHHLLSDRVEQNHAFAEIITQSRKMKAIFKYLEAVADSAEPVLIVGETGVGKELMVEAIHRLSGREGELVAVNVAGIDDNMFSDTLFGHRRGAFSGADHHRDGMVAQARGGTLFLDEIGDLGQASQVKLLRLLQEKKYYPLGSDLPIKTDARVICATNCNLSQAMEQGNFRADLYFRLAAHHVSIPPLRDRKEDIKLLLNHFLAELSDLRGQGVPTPPPELYKLLESYHFPGNVRELKAMTMDAMAHHDSGMLSMELFKRHIFAKSGMTTPETQRIDGDDQLFSDHPDPLPTIQAVTDLLIKEAMRRSGNNQGIAAALLGITRQTLNRRMQSKKKEGS
ncbi:MAG: sigma-54-dependent Fis family transcriptional regulator [Magnetococcales bacterium]|nr:sigma-54-dependent Fis family transcriptional regulator [Magnetococcales bacterium]MBF0150798.1 sigma-54-dependent Fis family transcriptional regulator [Magnetococcales bacterium]MBF0173993.1 sigma-54-dependent Fis family transcriptional regulator [Magnetococcales bacterium]MBF0348300.1 sigma-54-dependent Fis family transcriptional regulator [Magnetococcales bacterium]